MTGWTETGSRGIPGASGPVTAELVVLCVREGLCTERGLRSPISPEPKARYA